MEGVAIGHKFERGSSSKCMFNVYKNQQNRQTGSRNLMGPKTLPTIWGTYMKLVTKYQMSAINSYWEKCDEKYLGRTEGLKDRRTEVKQYTPSPFGERGYKNQNTKQLLPYYTNPTREMFTPSTSSNGSTLLPWSRYNKIWSIFQKYGTSIFILKPVTGPCTASLESNLRFSDYIRKYLDLPCMVQSPVLI